MNTAMIMASESVTTTSAEVTEDFAAKFAGSLKGSEVLTLSGDLGSGKTTFIRGLARGIEADPRGVSSPSYTIINIYEGALRLVHVDLYRLGDENEITELGLEDLLDTKTIMAVEWGERLPASMAGDIKILFEVTGDTNRRIVINR